MQRLPAVLGGDVPGARQHQRDDDAKDEPADVGEERDAPAVGRRTRESEVCLDQLVQEPGAEENQAASRTGKTITSPRTVESGYSTK